MSDLQLDRAGHRRSPAATGIARRSLAAQQGTALPSQPAQSEESSPSCTPQERRARPPAPRPDRHPLASRAARPSRLDLTEADLDQRRGSLLVRRGKGGRRREVGMEDWGWQELQPWLELRLQLPIGPLFCVINGATRGRRWATAAARAQLRRTTAAAGVRRRFAPTNFAAPTPSRWRAKACR